jgi:hypothetical protein
MTEPREPRLGVESVLERGPPTAGSDPVGVVRHQAIGAPRGPSFFDSGVPE